MIASRRDLTGDTRHSDRGHLLKEPPEAGKFLIGPHYLNHRPERGLVCCNDRFANRAFPVGYERHCWKIATGNNEDLNLRPIGPRNGIACQFLPERRIQHYNTESLPEKLSLATTSSPYLPV